MVERGLDQSHEICIKKLQTYSNIFLEAKKIRNIGKIGNLRFNLVNTNNIYTNK